MIFRWPLKFVVYLSQKIHENWFPTNERYFTVYCPFHVILNASTQSVLPSIVLSTSVSYIA
jgi:hypothetical protein